MDDYEFLLDASIIIIIIIPFKATFTTNEASIHFFLPKCGILFTITIVHHHQYNVASPPPPTTTTTRMGITHCDHRTSHTTIV
jgi:hypothetical protein